MAMDLNAKAAYIRGMMKGMEFDPTTQEGKIIVAMMDLLEEMAQTMTDPDNVDINAFLTLDLEMHAIWFCSMNKWYIWQNLTKPQPDYSRFTRLDVVRANNVPDVLSEHREILRVIREKDLDAIEPLIRRHLYGGLRRMGTQLYAEKYRSYFTGI